MKKILFIIQLILLLNVPSVFAGNGITKSGNADSNVFSDFNSISGCTSTEIQESVVNDSSVEKVAIRNFYPAYSFNVLRRPLYALNISIIPESKKSFLAC